MMQLVQLIRVADVLLIPEQVTLPVSSWTCTKGTDTLFVWKRHSVSKD